MHKIINKVKRSVALFLVFLLSFGSFAAVVSDNDGSAFITKAEFDSLKNNFQSQIDQYNTSIDAKIDGAIAAYLAGIKVTTTETYEVPIDNYKDMKWVNDLWVYAMQDNWAAGSTTDKTTDTWSWRQVHWGNYRNIRHGGIDLNSVWLNAGNKRDAHWQMHIDPDVSTNQYFGSSDFLSNRINRLSIPVLVLDLPLIGGYNVLKDGDDKIFLESMCEIYGNLNPRWDQAFDYEWGDPTKNKEALHTAIEFLEVTPNTEVNISSDDDYWLKLEARCVSGGYGFKLDADGVNYVPCEWDEIEPGAKLTFYQNFDAKAGTFAQPANWFIRGEHNARNTGYLSIMEWISLGGTNTQISNNRAQNFATKWTRASNEDWINYESILNDFMLGQDTTQICNVGNQKDIDEVSGSSWRYDWSKSEWKNVECTFDFYILPHQTNLATYRKEGVVNDYFSYVKTDTNSTIKWPLWPKMNVKDLRHSQYLLNKEPLKVGQGLPLIIDVPNNGILKMKIKYSVSDIASSTTPSQKAKLYVKKNDFTTNVSSDYFENQATSTTAAGSLNGYVMESNNTLEFAIPVKKENSVWMRLSPFDTSPSGLYATIDSISMQVEAE